MTDVVDSATRSRMMASIRGKDTSPEMRVRRYLHGAGLRFRLHDRKLPGSPDLVLPRRRIVVFVHGCFWHRHPGCRYAATPATRSDFWLNKFSANIARDERNRIALERSGWRVIIAWECEVRDETRLDELFWRILAESVAD